ncbi:MAG: UDP-N-acetylmuramate dehydrogenase [Bacilli bacterium]|nr:UDP-N-acetylmuramate dehydrogenase [Bacilli bacterium]
MNLENLNIGEIKYNVDLSEYTTYKLKAIGKILVIPKNINCLIKLIDYIKEKNLKYKILGNGSNLIFTKPIYEGILIKLNNLNDINIEDDIITVGAGYNLMKLSLKASMLGLSGMEFATGIPGSVGGSVYMNAGAYNNSISDVLISIKALDDNLNIKEISNKELQFGYRHSILQEKKYIVIEAKFKLKHGNTNEIMELVNKRRERRIASQPLEYPSAGSVFRNPTNDYAGRLIEEIGYKGHNRCGAMVSTKHANFIINTGNATGEDIKELIIEIKEKVKEKYNIELKVEQEFVE